MSYCEIIKLGVYMQRHPPEHIELLKKQVVKRPLKFMKKI